MSPKGSPGTPKTAEHKSKIAASMQAKAEIRAQGRRKAADAVLRAAAILAGPVDRVTLGSATSTLVQAVRNLVEADEASLELAEEVKNDLKRALEVAEADSKSFREALASVSDYDVIRAKSIGLIPAPAADAVIKRRQVSRASGGFDDAGWSPAGSGYLPCAEPGCMTKVNLSTGSNRCPDHQKAPPRSFIQRSRAGLTTVALDLELEDAEAVYARAEKDLALAAKGLEKVKARVDEYDRQVAGG